MKISSSTIIVILLALSLVGIGFFLAYVSKPMRLVGCYYYFWSFNNPNAEYNPTVQFQDGSQNSTMQASLVAGHDADIDFFALSYFSFATYDTPTKQMFQTDAALGNPMNLCIMIEYYNGANGQGTVDLNQFADHIWQQYAQQPSYQYWEDKPLLLVYTQAYIPPAWLDSRFTVRYVPLQVPYSIATALKIDPLLYREFQGVFPGFSNIKPGESANVSYPRDNGIFYAGQWNQAITISRMTQTSTCVMITSWNEFYEQTAIAPTVRYGTLYLNITSEYAQQYKSG
jgi:hypothetical protein